VTRAGQGGPKPLDKNRPITEAADSGKTEVPERHQEIECQHEPEKIMQRPGLASAASQR